MTPLDQVAQRRATREALMQCGVSPYPSVSLHISHCTRHILTHFRDAPTAFQSVSLAGRMLSRRIMGSASFAEIQDADGRMQLYLRSDDLTTTAHPTRYEDLFKKRMDIGDIIYVEGFVFQTKKGEITLHVKHLRLLAKALRPLPVVKESDVAGNKRVHDAFTSAEHRYRRRYVDLIVNPSVRELFRTRARMIQLLRSALHDKGYLEVETPILQPVHGGASAKPFVTHHHALDMPLFMRVANELYLKRLIVGGFDGVYEFAKDFRNEGMSRYHNPEFTQLELYVAYKDYRWMADFVEEMLCGVVEALHGGHEVEVEGRIIHFQRPWRRCSFYDALAEKTGEDLRQAGASELRAVAQAHNVSLGAAEALDRPRLLDRLFSLLCEGTFVHPTIVMDHPLCLSPLAKEHPTEAGVAARFELICNGKEICNAYSELNDPVEQRARFEEQQRQRAAGNEEAMRMDEDFLRAMEYGMPPTAGLGVGIDRLAMLMCDAASIQDVLFFPQMRQEAFASPAREGGHPKQNP